MNSSTRQLLLIMFSGPKDSDGSHDVPPQKNDALDVSETAARFGLGVQRVGSLDEAVTAIEQGSVAMAVLHPAASGEDVRPVVQPLAKRWPKLPLFVAGEDRAGPAQAALRAGAWGYLSSSAELEQLQQTLDERRSAALQPETEGQEDLTLAAAERLAIERALQASAGNVKRAAKTLGIARATLYRKMARFGLRS